MDETETAREKTRKIEKPSTTLMVRGHVFRDGRKGRKERIRDGRGIGGGSGKTRSWLHSAPRNYGYHYTRKIRGPRNIFITSSHTYVSSRRAGWSLHRQTRSREQDANCEVGGSHLVGWVAAFFNLALRKDHRRVRERLYRDNEKYKSDPSSRGTFLINLIILVFRYWI